MAEEVRETDSLGNPDASINRALSCGFVMLRYRGSRIYVDTDSVYGSTEIEKLIRIPGAPDNVKGLLLFRGEIVPLVSFFGGTAERSPKERITQKGKTEQYAIIFSIRGNRLAARVDEPPSICDDMGVVEKIGGNVCLMRRRHLERMLDFCVARTNENCAEIQKHGHCLKQRTEPALAGACCAA